ncbi:hypothetical protein GCM10023346_25260 [Arthrobacter gyeryongensis]|uniref:SnoaL-like domain-containing protein n=1 Tax=Arthrobacter gyeryongensis TaxID=1650592 RepID=A0ABP9SFI0_9MICC
MTTPTSTALPPVVAESLAAVNAFDLDRMVATFAEDACVNDARREISGIPAIRARAENEMIGDHVTMQPLEVVAHYGQTIVRSRYDGTYDKTSLPAETGDVGLLQRARRQDRRPRRDPQPALRTDSHRCVRPDRCRGARNRPADPRAPPLRCAPIRPPPESGNHFP